jgi:uncharacterized membrane protein
VNSGLIPPPLDFKAELPKEILERTDLNVLNIGLALASGAAGAYSFAERKGEILVGVMIAVALMPPACVVGIGIALQDVGIFGGASLLLLVNVICINIAGTLVLWKLGVKPSRIFRETESEKHVKKRVVTSAVILVVLSAIFAYSTYDAYLEIQFKEDIQREANNIADGLENVSEVEVTSIAIDNSNIKVRVTLFSETGNLNSTCAQTIKEGLEDKWTDYTFTVIVNEMQVSSGD